MTTEVLSLAVQLATLLSGLAAVAGIVIGVRTYRRQMNAQLFLAFTERYEAIMSELPEDARVSRASGAGALPPHWPGVYTTVLRYLNLCSEEYYLCRTGHLEKSLWAIWEEELKRTVRSLVRPEWPDLRPEFASYPEFRDYVDAILENGRGGPDMAPVAIPASALTPTAPTDKRRTSAIEKP